MSKFEINPIANRWSLLSDEYFSVNLVIESRKQEDGSIKFVVKSDSESFLHDQDLVFCMGHREDAEYMQHTRFKSFEAALYVYERFIEKSMSEKANTYYAMAVQRKYNNGVIIDNPKITQALKELEKNKS